MGLFDTIYRRVKERRERHEAGKRLGSYVDPALVEFVKANPDAALTPREGRIEFLIAVITDDDLARLSESVGKAIEVLRTAGAWIDSVSGSLVLATFGTVPAHVSSEPRQQRISAAELLRRELEVRVKIVHGSSRGITGDLGSRTFARFRSCFLRFAEALTLVVSLAPGEVCKVAEDGSDSRRAAE